MFTEPSWKTKEANRRVVWAVEVRLGLVLWGRKGLCGKLADPSSEPVLSAPVSWDSRLLKPCNLCPAWSLCPALTDLLTPCSGSVSDLLFLLWWAFLCGKAPLALISCHLELAPESLCPIGSHLYQRSFPILPSILAVRWSWLSHQQKETAMWSKWKGRLQPCLGAGSSLRALLLGSPSLRDLGRSLHFPMQVKGSQVGQSR